MVVGYFPLAKLAVLLVRQASRPISNSVKKAAKDHPVFRRYVCMPPAQFYNWCEVKVKMWLLNLGKPVRIPELNEAQAIELGGNLLGEAVLFFIAAAVVLNEHFKAARKQAKMEEEKRKEKEKLKRIVNSLHREVLDQADYIQELKELILQIVDVPEIKNRVKLPEAPTKKFQSKEVLTDPTLLIDEDTVKSEPAEENSAFQNALNKMIEKIMKATN